jgi:hypothetical protein
MAEGWPSVKLHFPFEELIAPFSPSMPFFPFDVLLQNLPKAEKWFKYRESKEKVKWHLSKEIQKE